MGRLSGRHVVIVHGWSDRWESMRQVGNPLRREGATISYVDYISREDRANYEDFAEGLDKELERLRRGGGLLGGDGELHFVTHSTGALVVRQWLAQYPQRIGIVGNLVFLAPPNFGSPLAATGRSLLGKVIKGRHSQGDFFEVGEQILHGLELASPLSWRLAEHDLLGAQGSVYHRDGIRASVITGHSGYGGLRHFANRPGTDGTIVVAGANLNVRCLQLNLARTLRQRWSRWSGFTREEDPEAGVLPPSLPFAVHARLNHASILELGSHAQLRGQVVRCLAATPGSYDALRTSLAEFTRKQVGQRKDLNFQQLLFRVRDDRGRAVPDYHLEFNVWKASRLQECYSGGPRHIPAAQVMTRDEEERSGKLDQHLEEGLHSHSQDASYKRYLISPDFVRRIVGNDQVVTMRIDAVTGDNKITYSTQRVDNLLLYHPRPDFPVKVRPFFPNTTTLIDVCIDRESNLLRIGQAKADFER